MLVLLFGWSSMKFSIRDSCPRPFPIRDGLARVYVDQERVALRADHASRQSAGMIVIDVRGPVREANRQATRGDRASAILPRQKIIPVRELPSILKVVVAALAPRREAIISERIAIEELREDRLGL
jgi:hypothetical protein